MEIINNNIINLIKINREEILKTINEYKEVKYKEVKYKVDKNNYRAENKKRIYTCIYIDEVDFISTFYKGDIMNKTGVNDENN